MTMRAFSCVVCLGTAFAAFADDSADRRLIDRVAPPPAREASAAPGVETHGATATVAAPGSAAPAAEALPDADSEVTLARARLEVSRARRALKANRVSEAARHAGAAAALLEKLPDSADASALDRQIAALLDRLQGTGSEKGARGAARVDAVLSASDGAADAPASSAAAARTGATDRLEGGATQSSPRAARGHADDDCDPVGSQIRILIDRTDDDFVDDMTFPADWQERTSRRARWSNGEIARGPSRTDADGRESHLAIYDISDLSYVPPDFALPVGFHPWLDLQAALDRDALRNRSMIFNGLPEDFAAGLPLLHYLGGVDPFAMRGPKYSFARQQQVLNLVNATLDPSTQARIMVLPAPPSAGTNQP